MMDYLAAVGSQRSYMSVFNSCPLKLRVCTVQLCKKYLVFRTLTPVTLGMFHDVPCQYFPFNVAQNSYQGNTLGILPSSSLLSEISLHCVYITAH